MKKFGLWIYDSYKYIFDSSRNPLRHIPDPASRMFIMSILAFMWSGAFAVYLGSILYFGLSVAAHIVLILMFFFTVAIFYDAERNKSSWLLKLRSEQKQETVCQAGLRLGLNIFGKLSSTHSLSCFFRQVSKSRLLTKVKQSVTQYLARANNGSRFGLFQSR